MLKLSIALAALLFAVPAAAQEAYPKRIPSAGGAVVIPFAGYQKAYDETKYAPARRADDYLYISGVIAGPMGTEGKDVAAFKLQAQRAFKTLQRILAADGLSFADVVMINTFHVWQGPGFEGTRDQQFEAFTAVKDEFMAPPHPA